MDDTVRAIAAHRIGLFLARYPDLLSYDAVMCAFTTLPQDVKQINSAVLMSSGIRDARPMLIVAGWECQDLSTAGSCKGIHGPRSGTFFDLLHVIGSIQQLRGPGLSTAHIIENTAFQHNWKSERIAVEEFKVVCGRIGTPVCCDAVGFGSMAHRVRNFRTNLIDSNLLQAACDAADGHVHDCTVQQLLEPGRTCAPVLRDDHFPQRVVNRAGGVRKALPTLVAREQSYAFRPGQAGAVYDVVKGWDEPTALERERAMGVREGDTAAPGITELQRRQALGRSIDIATLSSLVALCLVGWMRAGAPGAVSDVGLDRVLARPVCGLCDVTGLGNACMSVSEGAHEDTDIWNDAVALQAVQRGLLPDGLSGHAKCRVVKRMQLYAYVEGVLYRRWSGGDIRKVPPPDQRAELMRNMHVQAGHFGRDRTLSLLAKEFWWKGMARHVREMVRACPECARGAAVFGDVPKQLHPLPVRGLFYRWSVDLLGPLPETATGCKYVMVMVEHFSRYLDIAPIPSKLAEVTAAIFKRHVLGRFGSCAELLSDQGGEWQGAFHEVLRAARIDHRMTSADHPQGNGLTERAVQTVKRSLRKLTAGKADAHKWDEDLPFIMLGYNASVQKSTRLSPYQILHGVAPTVPPAICERFAEPLDLESPELAAQHVLERAAALERDCLEAGQNLLIAQHRDTLRYAVRRSGHHMPAVADFRVGDYVYVLQAVHSTLQQRARRVILRVVQVRAPGVLVLEGRCGRKVQVHCTRCAHCHMPNLNGELDPTLSEAEVDVACEVCGSPDDSHCPILLCDYCNKGYHVRCVELDEVPDGDWVCPGCLEAGITLEDLQRREQADGEDSALFPNAAQRRRDAAAADYHGRLVTRRVDGGARQWGKVVFRGGQFRPLYFRLCWQDGSERIVSMHHLLHAKQVCLEAAGRRLPKGIVIAAAVTGRAPLVLEALPDQWDLGQAEVLAGVVDQLMPGPRVPGSVTRLAAQVPVDARMLVNVPTHEEEVMPLLQVLDISLLSTVVEPCHGQGGITRVLRGMGLRVQSNDLDRRWAADSHEDALQPRFWKARAGVDAVIASPHFAVLDIMLPLAVLAAQYVVCCHVPGHYVSNPTVPRQLWFAELQRQGRLLILLGLPRGAMGMRCAWVVVFRSAAVMRSMVRPERVQSVPVSFMFG